MLSGFDSLVVEIVLTLCQAVATSGVEIKLSGVPQYLDLTGTTSSLAPSAMTLRQYHDDMGDDLSEVTDFSTA